MHPETPSAEDLARGQKACEHLERFQRCRAFDATFMPLALGSVGTWNAFTRGGWKVALVTGVFWLLLTVTNVYHFRKLKERAERDTLFLKTLKTRYGSDVYSEIKKSPHSLFYSIFQKRFLPFNRRTVTLP